MKLPTAQVTRDTILFVGGLAGLTYETLTVHAEKPTLIIAFIGMLGLPIFIRSDEARKLSARDTLQEHKDADKPEDESTS